MSENRPTTHCKHCVFSVKRDGSEDQIGCLANRIHGFRNAGTKVVKTTDDDASYYTVNSLCNLFRDEKWKHYNEAKSADLLERENVYLEKAYKEVEISFGIIIYDNEATHDKVQQTVDSIVGSEYDPKKIKIIITTKGKKENLYEFVRIVEETKAKGYQIELVCNAPYSTNEVVDFDAFNKCRNYHYFAFCESGAVIASSTLGRINDHLNSFMKKYITFSQGCLFGETNFIMRHVASSEYLKFNDFQVMFESVKKRCQENGMHLEL